MDNHLKKISSSKRPTIMADQNMEVKNDEKSKDKNGVENNLYEYQQNKEKFVRELIQFHTIRGTPLPRIPCIGGKQIDLFLLYKTITDLGGFDKATEELRWEEIQAIFELPHACTNAAQGLKQIYVRYLLSYEKSQNREPPRNSEYMEDDGRKAEQKVKKQANYVHLTYNQYQHRVTMQHRQLCAMSTNVIEESRHLMLERSLQSGLPNEVDFAINVCTLLSNEGRHVLQLTTCPKLTPLLLGHVGVFEDGPGSLYHVIQYSWTYYCKRNYLRFWYDAIDKKFHRLLYPSFSTQGSSLPSTSTEEFDDVKEELFNLGIDISCKNVEGQRVHQIGNIFRNLSFEEANMAYLSTNSVFYRFMMMCINSKFSSLRQIALDTLGNIATRMVLSELTDVECHLVIDTVHDCIRSPDRYNIVRGLEILSGLCQVGSNEPLLSANIQKSLYETIINMLCVHDIQLIVFTLECLYQLSEIGGEACDGIANVSSAINMLVNLMTIEAQSYGPNSLMGIKVVEHVPAAMANQHFAQPAGMSVPPVSIAINAPGPSGYIPPIGTPRPPYSVVSTGQVQNQMIAPGRTVVTDSHVTPMQTQSITPRPISAGPFMAPRPMFAPQTPQTAQHASVRGNGRSTPSPAPTPPPPAMSPIPSTVQSVGVRTAQNGDANSHQFATPVDQNTTNWMRANFEYGTPGECGVSRSTIYSQYINMCSKNGISNVPNINAFGTCVRTVFPQTEATQVKHGNQSADIIFKGIKPKQQMLQRNEKGYHISSPMIKTPSSLAGATLINGNTSVISGDKTPVVVNGMTSDASVQNRPLLNTNGVASPDPNLIKSLLVNKVRGGIKQNNHMPLLQVDGADSPHSSMDEDELDFKSIPQLDGANSPPPSPTPLSSSPKSTKSPQPNRSLPRSSSRSSSPRASSMSPRAKKSSSRSTSPHGCQSTMSPPMSPMNRSPKAKYNLEVCVQAAKAAEVVPENHQCHEKRIERVENQCSPSKLHMNAELVKQLEKNPDDYAMEYELEAPKAEKVSLVDQPENCDTMAVQISDGVPSGQDKCSVNVGLSPIAECVTAVKDSQTCSSELNLTEELQPNMLIAESKLGSKQELILNDMKSDALSHNGLSKDNNKLLAAFKDTLKEESELLRKGDKNGFNGGNGLKQHLFGLHSHFSNDITVGMVMNQSTGPVATSSNSVNVPAGSTAQNTPSMLAAQLTQTVPTGPLISSVVVPPTSVVHQVPTVVQQIAVTPSMQQIPASTNHLVQIPSGTIVQRLPSGQLVQTSTGQIIQQSQARQILPQPGAGQTIVQTVGNQLVQQTVAGQIIQQQPATGQIIQQSVGGQIVKQPTLGQIVQTASGQIVQKGAGVQIVSQQTPIIQPATNSMGQRVMVRLATPQSAAQTFVRPASNQTPIPIVSQQLVIQPQQTKPVSIQNVSLVSSVGSSAVPYVVSSSISGDVVVSQPPSLNSVMSAVSQSKVAVTASPASVGNPIINPAKRPFEGAANDAAKRLKPAPTPPPPLNTSCAFTCQWNHCNRGFDTVADIKRHVLKDHYDRKASRSICRWAGCDGVIRQRWAMVTHIQDRHLTETSLKTAQTQSTMLPCPQQVVPVSLPVAPSPAVPIINQMTTTARSAPSYPIDAAIQAIRRFASRPPYPEFMEVKEGPVTKHIRLTSGLILRNLARYSSTGRAALKKHERHLSCVALSCVEASTALAHCLGELQSYLHTDSSETTTT